MLKTDVLPGPGEEAEGEGGRGGGTRLRAVVSKTGRDLGQVHHH